jgi:hypothetical protein
VHVDDAIEAGKLLLQRHEALDGAEVVAEVQRAARLDAGEDARLVVGVGGQER